MDEYLSTILLKDNKITDQWLYVKRNAPVYIGESWN
jgi:hypothetical protein